MTEDDEMAIRFIKNGSSIFLFPVFPGLYVLTMMEENMFSLPFLEHQLVMYVTADDKDTFTTPFDLSSIPVVTREQADAEDRTKKLTTATPTLKAPSTGPKKPTASRGADAAASATAAAQKYAQQLMQIPELKAYGAVLKSSALVELTEAETEYSVNAIKHIFKDHIVLQYDVKNTIPDTVLEDVSVVATPEDEDVALEEDFIIPAPKLATDEPGTVYVAFKRPAGDHSYPIASFTNVLKFTSKEIDPTTGEPEEGGYEDEYQVDNLELSGSDYVTPAFAGSFDHVWEQTGATGEEASETLQLTSTKSIAGSSLSNISVIHSLLRLIRCSIRCHRTAYEILIIATIGRNRCCTYHEHTYTETLRKDNIRRQSCCECEDGVLGQDRGDDQDFCSE